jgi:dihydroorotase
MNSYAIEGHAVLPDATRQVRIEIDSVSGTILSVNPSTSSLHDDTLILPGIIDIHVHAREYPRPDSANSKAVEKWEAACRKETFATAGEAAINGGVTLYAAMPNDAVPPSDGRIYGLKAKTAESSECPVILYGAAVPDSEPWANIPYKVYLDSHPSSVSFTDWRSLEPVLARFKGYQLFFHAEDPAILRENAGAGPRWVSRPPEAEIVAVEKILELSAKLGLHSHICHISTRRAVELIAEHNRRSSSKVSCEVTPHHLFFSVDGNKVASVDGDVAPSTVRLLESNPPLRGEGDRAFLLAALRAGHVHLIASDHAPHTLEDKENGAPGVPHLDTLSAFAGWLVQDAGFSPTRVAEVLAEVPGRMMSPYLDEPQGRIEQGATASLTLLDLSHSTEVEGKVIRGRGPLKTRCAWSPFQGLSLPGAVAATIVRGKKYDFRRLAD